MNQRLSGWVSIAEIVASIAVVITLVFLVVGMRENTDALQAQTFQELMRDLNEWRLSISGLEREELLFRFNDGDESITLGQVGAIRLAFLRLWGIYEAAFFANQRGVLGPDEWRRFEVMICIERSSSFSETFFDKDFRGLGAFSTMLTPSFSKYVQDHCR